MAIRTGEQAIAWGHNQVHHRSMDWRRNCLSFVRQCFNVQARIANAGLAWDLSKHKHRVTSGSKIPRGVPVFWETSSVADHVALSLGGGNCLSTDAVRSGQVDVVNIDALTRKWGMQLKGWTDDMNGVLVHQAAFHKKTPNITAYLTAKQRTSRQKALHAIAESGNTASKKAAKNALDAIDRIEKAEREYDRAHATLKKNEVK